MDYGRFGHAAASRSHAHHEVEEIGGIVRDAVVRPGNVLHLGDVALFTRLLKQKKVVKKR